MQTKQIHGTQCRAHTHLMGRSRAPAGTCAASPAAGCWASPQQALCAQWLQPLPASCHPGQRWPGSRPARPAAPAPACACAGWMEGWPWGGRTVVTRHTLAATLGPVLPEIHPQPSTQSRSTAKPMHLPPAYSFGCSTAHLLRDDRWRVVLNINGCIRHHQRLAALVEKGHLADADGVTLACFVCVRMPKGQW